MRTVLVIALVLGLATPFAAAQDAGIAPPPAAALDDECDAGCQQARENFARAAAEHAARPDCMVGPAGDPCRASAPPVITPTLVEQLGELHAKYNALKANKDKSARMLLIAALLAAGLKLLLSGVNLLAGKKPKRWLSLVALGLAVPIALLSHYAGGNSWFDSLVYAGAGPGAIVVHELLKLLRPAKKPEAAAA